MLAVASALSAGTGALAQSAAPPAAPQTDPAATLRQTIASNAASPQQICPAILPIINANPSTAVTLIEDAQNQPALLEPLCECLSQAQNTLKKTDPTGAAVVAQAVANASPAFQACYAVALAPGDGGGGAPPVATAATGTGTGTGTGAPFSPVGFSGLSGSGGGPSSSPQ